MIYLLLIKGEFDNSKLYGVYDSFDKAEKARMLVFEKSDFSSIESLRIERKVLNVTHEEGWWI